MFAYPPISGVKTTDFDEKQFEDTRTSRASLSYFIAKGMYGTILDSTPPVTNS